MLTHDDSVIPDLDPSQQYHISRVPCTASVNYIPDCLRFWICDVFWSATVGCGSFSSAM